MSAGQFSGGAAVERRGVCRVCHRALKNPKYVELGIGPICARKQLAKIKSDSPAGINQAQFDVVNVNDQIVWIRDVGVECRSVTNDAERVCGELAIEYGDRRIIYRDTDGNWDELLHAHGKFIGFAPARNLAP